MSNATLRIPSYRLHKPSGRAVVTIGGRDIYLGNYNSAASRREYKRVIAEWHVHGGTLPKQANDLTITELAAAFMRHAKDYYRRPDGSQTNELKNLTLSIRRLKDIYGRTPAATQQHAAVQHHHNLGRREPAFDLPSDRHQRRQRVRPAADPHLRWR